MGSIFHIYIFEELDSEVLADLQSKNFKVICSDLDGKNLFEFKFPEKFVLVFSNEASGPSDSVKKIADEIVTIPKIGNAESLNVAIASGIILSRALSIQATHFI